MSNENENENNYDYLSIPMDVKEKLLNNINSKKQNDINDNNNNSFNQEEDSLSSEQENHHHHDHNIDQNDAMKKLFYVSIVCLIFMCIEIIGGYLARCCTLIK